MAKGKIQLTYTGDQKIIKILSNDIGGLWKGYISKMQRNKDDILYIIEDAFNQESVTKQLQKYLDATLPRYYKSQPELDELK